MGNKTAILNIRELYKDPRLIEAIEKWDVLSFLNEHGADISIDGKNIGIDFIGIRPCIFCGDSNNHFGVNINEKYGSCFVCKGYAGPLKLVSYYGKMSLSDAFKYLTKYTEDERNVEERVKSILFQKKEETPYIPTKKDEIPKSRLVTLKDLQVNKYLRDFFIKRKLYLWHINRYGLRLMGTHLLWPIYLKNKPVSYQRRNILFKSYFNPNNLANYLYGEDNIIPEKPLILVEGFLDYTRIDSFIRCYYKNHLSVTTGMAKSISNQQIIKLSKCGASTIIVIYDNDSWFDYMRVRNSIPFDVDFIILPKGCDPNDLSWSQLIDIFKTNIDPLIQRR